MEEEKTYFRTECISGKSIEQIAEENPTYTRIYVCKMNEDGKTVLSLRKGDGDVLYIVSSVDRDNLRDYFTRLDTTEVENSPPSKEKDPTKRVIKKAKQQNLLSFFGKQQK